MENLEQPNVSCPLADDEQILNQGGESNRQVVTHSTNDSLGSTNLESASQNAKIDTSNGSKDYGKFASADELLKAYNSLQAEFTRKCQALNAHQSNTSSVEPLEMIQKIKQSVDEFSTSRPLAQKYAKEMMDKVISSESPLDPKSLNKAYTEVLESHFTEPENLVRDENFLSNYIFSDTALCDQIVTKYLTKLADKKTVPLVAKSSKSSVTLRQITNPQTINEAGEMARKIITKK